MFFVYNLVFYEKGLRFSEWYFDLEIALKHVHEYSYWFVEKNEVIEGLYYPIKVIARSADVV